ncbi:ACT domain-containing protein ACR1 isoform X2 [Cinnamomum micranthum f. kanehirae]|uniref:ACT domain-containing protein ACR n=1 Tax=Cinnamomum micranthum f. kanehirae TaxID=337451 RepID=A0A3S3N8V2_9MAGN|nr:ACT domain-containing protein ACR1 isoform X2 [Cinnamomum micranthum f. kanehirae]
MENCYRPYFDPDFESLIERINPPRVCIDNDTCEDCTLVKVDSANKHGILLEMVQVLTDLDLIISKSYISSDGVWLMDVFHVTDQHGNKLTDESLIHYIEQALCAGRRDSSEAQHSYLGRSVGPMLVPGDHTALEMMGTDRPGLLSEISAVLVELNCDVVAAEAWTHNKRAACIIYMTDGNTGGPICDRERLSHVEEQLDNVVGAHHPAHLVKGEERRGVKLAGPMAGRTHTERRLHQLMLAQCDYEEEEDEEEMKRRRRREKKVEVATEVSIESCKEKGYSVVSVRSRDRPKLLFDTVCTLTDMEYVVFHAAISSHGSLAVQEYYVRHMDGCTLDSKGERQRVTQCLAAAVERRVSHGLRLEVCTSNRQGLLSDITRVFREHGLSITRAHITTSDDGDTAIGTFYVTDASGNEVDPKTVESVRKEIGGSVLTVPHSPSSVHHPHPHSDPTTTTSQQKFSLGSLLWSQLERLSSNFGSINS